MRIEITSEMYDAIGKVDFKSFGVSDEATRWRSVQINLVSLNNNQVRKLFEVISPHKTVKGAKAALRDLATWMEAAMKGSDRVKCKTTKHFAALAFEWLQKEPNHRLYEKDEDRDTWRAYYVGCITFHERQPSRQRREREDSS